MALLDPVVAVLDETDSGLDIDALRVVGRGVRTVREAHPSSASSWSRTTSASSTSLSRPGHLLVDAGWSRAGSELAQRVESGGYDQWR